MTARRVETCTGCGRPTAKPVLVHEEYGNSGPGHSRYACPGCAPEYPPLVDLVAQLQALHRIRRSSP